MVAVQINRESVTIRQDGETFIARYNPDDFEKSFRALVELGAEKKFPWSVVAGLRAEMIKQHFPKTLQANKHKSKRIA